MNFRPSNKRRFFRIRGYFSLEEFDSSSDQVYPTLQAFPDPIPAALVSVDMRLTGGVNTDVILARSGGNGLVDDVSFDGHWFLVSLDVVEPENASA